jgi:hypothetical protein
VEVVYESDVPRSKDDFKLSLFLDVAKTQDGTATSVASKTINEEDLEYHPGSATGRETYTYKFDFYNLSEKNENLQRDDLDGLVYSNLSGSVLVGNETQRFDFRIKNYHELVRYKLLVSRQSNSVNVKILDADYGLKVEVFRPDEPKPVEGIEEPESISGERIKGNIVVVEKE